MTDQGALERAHFAVHWDDERLTSILERIAATDVLYLTKFVTAGIAAALNSEHAAAASEARAAERERCEQIVQNYIDRPTSGPKNNTLSAFEQGMDHMAGCIDNASAILDAIRALATPARSPSPQTTAIPLTRQEAVDQLAQQLYWTWHKLDVPVFPDEDFPEWERQSEYVRDSYREAVEDFLLCKEAIGCALATDAMVEAGIRALEWCRDDGDKNIVLEIYRAMMDAARVSGPENDTNSTDEVAGPDEQLGNRGDEP